MRRARNEIVAEVDDDFQFSIFLGSKDMWRVLFDCRLFAHVAYAMKSCPRMRNDFAGALQPHGEILNDMLLRLHIRLPGTELSSVVITCTVKYV